MVFVSEVSYLAICKQLKRQANEELAALLFTEVKTVGLTKFNVFLSSKNHFYQKIQPRIRGIH